MKPKQESFIPGGGGGGTIPNPGPGAHRQAE